MKKKSNRGGPRVAGPGKRMGAPRKGLRVALNTTIAPETRQWLFAQPKPAGVVIDELVMKMQTTCDNAQESKSSPNGECV